MNDSPPVIWLLLHTALLPHFYKHGIFDSESAICSSHQKTAFPRNKYQFSNSARGAKPRFHIQIIEHLLNPFMKLTLLKIHTKDDRILPFSRGVIEKPAVMPYDFEADSQIEIYEFSVYRDIID
jgi:hypothetical protein